MRKVEAITALMSTPIRPATCGFCAVARIAVPRRVRYTSSASAAIIATHTPMIAIWTLVISGLMVRADPSEVPTAA